METQSSFCRVVGGPLDGKLQLRSQALEGYKRLTISGQEEITIFVPRGTALEQAIAWLIGLAYTTSA